MIILLDGPMGTELAARGVSTPGPAWRAVSFHLRNIYEKLEVHSKSEAVVKALREKLV